MFAPISFNVIHQALGWHKFPQPTLRVLSWKDEGDAVVAEYLATWKGDQVTAEFWGYKVHYTRQGRALEFAALLEKCFCSDIQITAVEWNEDPDTITAILYVRVDKAAIYMAEYMQEKYS